MAVSIAKSGANLHLSLTTETFDAMFCGMQTVTTTPISLYPLGRCCFQVFVQADPDNASGVFVGNNAQGQFVQLNAGVSIAISINDVGKIYVCAVAGTQTVNFIAMI